MITRRALLQGAGGLGAIVLAPVILTLGARLSRKRLLVVAMTSYGAATALVGVAPVWWVAVIGLALYGGAYLAIASALNTTVQLLAREDMRGKVIAIYLGCLTGALPVGLVLWGWAADAWGIRPVTVVAGLLLVVVTGWSSSAVGSPIASLCSSRKLRPTEQPGSAGHHRQAPDAASRGSRSPVSSETMRLAAATVRATVASRISSLTGSACRVPESR